MPGGQLGEDFVERGPEALGIGIDHLPDAADAVQIGMGNQGVGDAAGGEQFGLGPGPDGVEAPVEQAGNGDVGVGFAPGSLAVLLLHVVLVVVELHPRAVGGGEEALAPFHAGAGATGGAIDAEGPKQVAFGVDKPPFTVDFFDAEKARGRAARGAGVATVAAACAGRTGGGGDKGQIPRGVFGQFLRALDFAGPGLAGVLAKGVDHGQGEGIEAGGIDRERPLAEGRAEPDNLAGLRAGPIQLDGHAQDGGGVHGSPVALKTPRKSVKIAEPLDKRVVFGQGRTGHKHAQVGLFRGAHQKPGLRAMGERVREVADAGYEKVQLDRGAVFDVHGEVAKGGEVQAARRVGERHDRSSGGGGEA